MRNGDVILSDKTSWCASADGEADAAMPGGGGGGRMPAKAVSRRHGEEVEAREEAPVAMEGVNLRIAFKVCVEDHVMYARVHDDLVVVKRLTLAEALTGCAPCCCRTRASGSCA